MQRHNENKQSMIYMDRNKNIEDEPTCLWRVSSSCFLQDIHLYVHDEIHTHLFSWILLKSKQNSHVSIYTLSDLIIAKLYMLKNVS